MFNKYLVADFSQGRVLSVRALEVRTSFGKQARNSAANRGACLNFAIDWLDRMYDAIGQRGQAKVILAKEDAVQRMHKLQYLLPTRAGALRNFGGGPNALLHKIYSDQMNADHEAGKRALNANKGIINALTLKIEPLKLQIDALESEDTAQKLAYEINSNKIQKQITVINQLVDRFNKLQEQARKDLDNLRTAEIDVYKERFNALNTDLIREKAALTSLQQTNNQIVALKNEGVKKIDLLLEETNKLIAKSNSRVALNNEICQEDYELLSHELPLRLRHLQATTPITGAFSAAKTVQQVLSASAPTGFLYGFDFFDPKEGRESGHAIAFFRLPDMICAFDPNAGEYHIPVNQFNAWLPPVIQVYGVGKNQTLQSVTRKGGLDGMGRPLRRL